MMVANGWPRLNIAEELTRKFRFPPRQSLLEIVAGGGVRVFGGPFPRTNEAGRLLIAIGSRLR